MKIAIFPGSFDPFTVGHAAIVERASRLFDKIVIAIGINTQKKYMLPPEERELRIAAFYSGNPKIEVRTYNSLTVDFADEIGAKFIVRGVRSSIDFEYERTIAEANRKLSGIETVILCSDPELAHISSSLVRELAAFGKDISEFLP